MKEYLSIETSEASSAGVKTLNQDAIGSCTPENLSKRVLKGHVFACADGVSSSTVSQIASDNAIRIFIEQYYLSSECWTVQHAGEQTLQQINAELYGRTRQSRFRYDIEKGYVCTFSALILKGELAHVFHIGDAKVVRIREGNLDTLTYSHRIKASAEQSYLCRALGAAFHAQIDYQAFALQPGDIYVLMTDGAHEYVSDSELLHFFSSPSIEDEYCDIAARISALALRNGSKDNLSIQCIKIRTLANDTSFQKNTQTLLPLAIPSSLDEVDGYVINKELFTSNRSHVFLATECESKQQVVLKIPSADLQDDPALLHKFGIEEWIIRRIHSPYVIGSTSPMKHRQHLFMVSDYFHGQHLNQWIIDHPNPDIETVRNIVEQIGKGLMAMHTMQILHQDIRPENIMIDNSGNVKIIDMGTARVAGLTELVHEVNREILGTAMYSAPEYFVGDLGSEQSDLYSLAMITYYLLSGKFPYGTKVSKCRTLADQNKLSYVSVLDGRKAIPPWIDHTLKHALQINRIRRCETISEFLHHLRHPSPAFLKQVKAPLIERHPLRVWKCLTALSLLGNAILAMYFL